jgi:hypothetical protein
MRKEWTHTCTNMYTSIHLSVSVILWLSVNLRVCCSLEKSDVIRGLLLFEEQRLYSTAQFVWSSFCSIFKQVKIKVILQSTISRPLYLGVRHLSGTRGQYFSVFFQLFLDSYGFVYVGRPFWREVGPIVLNFCWALPAQPFSGLSPTDSW